MSLSDRYDSPLQCFVRKIKLHNFCVTFKEDDSCDVIYISEKKKGMGEENLFKRDGRKDNCLPQK